ncbi:hypothetical protein HZS_7684, partial [Henneguya salminicola]
MAFIFNRIRIPRLKNFVGIIFNAFNKNVAATNKKLRNQLFVGGIILSPAIASLIFTDVSCFIKKGSNSCDLICHYCRDGNIDQINKIFKKDGDINCRHSLGWTPLHSAASNGHIELATILIKNGADVNALDEFPGVHKVAARKHIHIMEASEIRARDFGADFNMITDFTGFTPLHYAVFLQDLQMIKLLLDSGADITIKNTYGQTPADLALTDEIKSFLLSEYEKAVEVKRQRDKEERKKFPLEKRLKEFIVGQEEAINTVSSTIRRREGGWTRGDKPLVFLFLGSSGVGKTELAKQLANYLFKNNNKCFIRVDMSEYQNKHEVSKFIGAPPGYIGYDQGGQLTSNLKACPNAVVLFDEIEKAHPDMITIMLQLFDEGRLTDGQGNTISCPSAIFIMTSNLASEEIAKYATKLRLQKSETDSENVTVSKQFKDKIMYPRLKDFLTPTIIICYTIRQLASHQLGAEKHLLTWMYCVFY